MEWIYWGEHSVCDRVREGGISSGLYTLSQIILLCLQPMKITRYTNT